MPLYEIKYISVSWKSAQLLYSKLDTVFKGTERSEECWKLELSLNQHYWHKVNAPDFDSLIKVVYLFLQDGDFVSIRHSDKEYMFDKASLQKIFQPKFTI